MLVCCARLVLDPVTETRLEALLAAAIDWPRLLARAAAHGLTPLLAHHLTGRIGSNARVPAAVADLLHTESLVTAARNLQQARELGDLVNAMDVAGVPCLPFKGPLVAQDVYGNLALRSFGDLDVAVPPRALARAREVLVAAGYRSPYTIPTGQELTFLRAYGHLVLVREGAAPVEVHWRFAPDAFPSIDVGDAYSRAHRVTVGGSAVLSLSPEDLLVTLCVHGGKHVWRSLEWVAGVAELLRRGDVDLHAALRTADQVGATRFVHLGLRIAHELLDAPLSTPVAASVMTPTVTHLAGEVYRVLAKVPETSEHDDRPARHLRYHLRAQPTVAARARLLSHLILLPTLEDRDRVPLPGRLARAYTIVRPARLGGRYVAAAAARVRRRERR